MTVHIEHLPERRVEVRQGVLSESSDFIGRLGRHVEHDERSLAYAVEHIVDELLPPKTVSWRRWSPILDQGDLGSCTGNALTGALACEPFCTVPTSAGQFNEAFAVSLYSHATQIDGIPGQYPPNDTGSSGLAVCKVAKSMGLIRSYGHALTVNGLLHALQIQPVIVGVPWFQGFDTPKWGGEVQATGAIAYGQAFDGQTIPAISLAIPASKQEMIPLGVPAQFGQSVLVTASAATVKLAAYSMP